MDAIIALGGIGSAFGLSASAGLNAYIPLLIFALAAKFPLDNPLIELSSPYDILTNWWVIGLLVVLLVIAPASRALQRPIGPRRFSALSGPGPHLTRLKRRNRFPITRRDRQRVPA